MDMSSSERSPRSDLREHGAVRRSAPDRATADRGFSLTEVIIAIVLISIVVIGMLETVRTSITTSSTSRAAAQVETAVVNASDRVNRAPKTCDYTVYAQAAVQTQGWAPTAATVQHEYYVPGPDATTNGSWQTGSADYPACPGPDAPDLLVQRVTITIISPDADVRRSIQVVKSDV